MVNKVNVKIGDKYNKLTIIEDLGYHTTTGGNKLRIMKCKCECGNIKNVLLNELRTGKTKSCGCYNLEKAGEHLSTHNLSGTRLYSIWKDMKKRCFNKNTTNYDDYGGRGITVCEEWASDYKQFHDWSINNGYNDKLSIDRIDVNGNYEPNNCRWVTSKVQNSNTRKQKEFIAISPEGKSYTHKVISQFAELHNLERRQISDCLNGKQKSHRGWTFKRLEVK